MTIQEGKQLIINSIGSLYHERESSNIASILMEWITGFAKIDQLLNKSISLNEEEYILLQKSVHQLSTGEPIQYIMGEAWFMGMPFKVTSNTLIPRPETEELVAWILADLASQAPSPLLVLEIGTGTGCIPVSLKKNAPYLLIESIDINKAAVLTATENALLLETPIEFTEMDFLDEGNWKKFMPFHIIVSNPPYIKESEKASMHPNVLEFEPAMALFVPDNDAVIFYKKIKLFSEKWLLPNGTIYFEINEQHAKEVMNLFEENTYHVELKKDMQGKDRMIKVVKLN